MKLHGVLMLALIAGCQSVMLGPPSGPVLSEFSQQVSPRVVLAGALKPEAIDAIKASNAIVIDLRHPQEGASKEARQMASHGVTWISLPQGRETPSVDDVQYLDEILSAWPGRNVVLHCATGNRAGKLWASRRISQGVPREEAVREVSGVVTMPAVMAAIAAPAENQNK